MFWNLKVIRNFIRIVPSIFPVHLHYQKSKVSRWTSPLRGSDTDTYYPLQITITYAEQLEKGVFLFMSNYTWNNVDAQQTRTLLYVKPVSDINVGNVTVFFLFSISYERQVLLGMNYGCLRSRFSKLTQLLCILKL